MNQEIYIPTSNYLKNLINSIWQINGTTPFCDEIIIPKGIVEAIFDFSESPATNVRIQKNSFILPRCFINGFNVFPIQKQLPKNQVYLGIQFQPFAVKRLFKSPASLFSNTTVDLSLIDASFKLLWEQMAEKKSFTERVAIITQWIEKKCIFILPREQILNQVLFRENPIDLSVSKLSKKVFYSTRQLARKVYECTDMNTEEWLLYKKYLSALHLIHHSPLSLTKIAYTCNFADQSHFTKVFKSFTQMTPRQYRSAKSRITGHIYKNVR